MLGEVERRYRTVLDAPDNDDNLKELQKIGEKIIDLQTSEPAAVIRQKKILMLLEKGYDVSQISQRIGITKRHVQRILKENNVTPKPNFVYKITNNNGTALMFSNTLRSIFNYFSLNSHSSNKQKINELSKNGLYIKTAKDKYCWHDIPNAALYYLDSKWYVKF